MPEFGNRNLQKAKSEKNDEFWTVYESVARELGNYTEFFNGKKVLCNCNDTEDSAFTRYFSDNFSALGLAGLAATSYNPGGRGTVYRHGVGTEALEGDGGFRSVECLKLLDECDVVVTNPPFSVFREYIRTLIDHGKKFLVIGNNNAVSYGEIFSLMMSDQIWLGVSPRNMRFMTGDGGTKSVNASWFTNIPHGRRREPIALTKHYSPDEYPKYDNYDAIEVSRVCDIPCDYGGMMGVPITFLDKYCPDQFSILGRPENLDIYGLKTRVYTNDECRAAYRAKFGKDGVYDLNARPVLDIGGVLEKTYARVFIARK